MNPNLNKSDPRRFFASRHRHCASASRAKVRFSSEESDRARQASGLQWFKHRGFSSITLVRGISTPSALTQASRVTYFFLIHRESIGLYLTDIFHLLLLVCSVSYSSTEDETRTQILSIKKVTPEDLKRNYVCHARNAEGEAEQAAKVKQKGNGCTQLTSPWTLKITLWWIGNKGENSYARIGHKTLSQLNERS